MIKKSLLALALVLESSLFSLAFSFSFALSSACYAACEERPLRQGHAFCVLVFHSGDLREKNQQKALLDHCDSSRPPSPPGRSRLAPRTPTSASLARSQLKQTREGGKKRKGRQK